MRITFLLTILISIVSCDVIELKPLNEEVMDINRLVPINLPADQAEAVDLFHGDNGKTWKALAFTFMEMEGMLECRIDDRISINTDGTFRFDGGSFLCGGEDNERFRSGTWEIDGSGSSITFSFDGQSHTAMIDGFVSDTLALTSSYLGIDIHGIYLVE